MGDKAFKPAGAPQKASIEALGFCVKAYKSHQNASRALDKKRNVIRTVVLVSGLDAPPLLAYLAGRPDLSNVNVVAESSSKAPPAWRQGCARCFEAAVAALQTITHDVPNVGDVQ